MVIGERYFDEENKCYAYYNHSTDEYAWDLPADHDDDDDVTDT